VLCCAKEGELLSLPLRRRTTEAEQPLRPQERKKGEQNFFLRTERTPSLFFERLTEEKNKRRGKVAKEKEKPLDFFCKGKGSRLLQEGMEEEDERTPCPFGSSFHLLASSPSPLPYLRGKEMKGATPFFHFLYLKGRKKTILPSSSKETAFSESEHLKKEFTYLLHCSSFLCGARKGRSSATFPCSAKEGVEPLLLPFEVLLSLRSSSSLPKKREEKAFFFLRREGKGVLLPLRSTGKEEPLPLEEEDKGTFFRKVLFF